jgi:LuxR family maltose regulon positive regulatory protein
MVTKLLSTKLYMPPYRSDMVPRQRLIEHLDAGLRGRVTLVSAPAGFGKTTLVSEWVQHVGRPAAWLSLDKNDNDITRFLTYMIAALQHVNEDVGGDIQAALGESQSPNLEMILTKFVNDIEVIPEQFIFVLDDYHFIEAEPVNSALNFLIEYQPSNMHLVISSRSDPLLPISRLRVRGELREVRVRDLRFTKDETAAFLNDLMGFDLSPEDIAALEERTEGWVASLQLAALSMRGRDDWPEFIAAFSGSHRYVIDYLADEIMSRQPEEVQMFLRRTSILERFSAPLCDAVVNGDVNGNTNIIDYLEHSNLFLIPLDDHREWFRYHHLFADFLRLNLHKEEPEQLPELHRHASQWFEINGLMDEAIRHALAAKDLERATRLVESIAGSLVIRRSSNILINLINQLPSEIWQKSPMLCVWYAWALIFLGQSDAVEPILKIAELHWNEGTGVPLNGYISTVRAYLANLKGDYQKAIDLSNQALEQMSKSSPEEDTLIFRGAAVIWLGVNHRMRGDLDRAREYFIEAVKLNEEAGSIYAAISAKCQSANLAMIQGQLHQAKEICQQGFLLAKRWADEAGEGQRTLVAASELHIMLGTVLYQWNDLEGAVLQIRHAVELLEVGEDQGRIDAYRILAFIHHAEGDYEAAFDLFGKINSLTDKISLPRVNSLLKPSFEKLRILLSRSRPEMAYLLNDVAKEVEGMRIRPDDGIDLSNTDYAIENKHADLARMLIALERVSEALPLIEHLLQGARSSRRSGDEINYLVLKALAHYALEDDVTALVSLSEALTLAKPQGYLRLFIDEGIPMAEMLQIATTQNVEPDYAEKLLALFPDEIRESMHIRDIALSQPLVEPLSDRELEVLQLMTEGYRYKEIAEQLVISVNTVRHHTRNVYSKLNVNNRAQAIARANELNLL